MYRIRLASRPLWIFIILFCAWIALNPGAAQAQALEGAPSNLAASAVSATQIDLTWVDNSTDETSFQVQYSGPFGWSTPRVIAAGSTSYTVNGLVCGTAYSLRVRAHNSGSNLYSAYSNIATA